MPSGKPQARRTGARKRLRRRRRRRHKRKEPTPHQMPALPPVSAQALCLRRQPSRATLSPRPAVAFPSGRARPLSQRLKLTDGRDSNGAPAFAEPHFRMPLQRLHCFTLQICSDAPLWMRVVTHRVPLKQRTSARCYHGPASGARIWRTCAPAWLMGWSTVKS
jgi:hypothetical protein